MKEKKPPNTPIEAISEILHCLNAGKDGLTSTVPSSMSRAPKKACRAIKRENMHKKWNVLRMNRIGAGRALRFSCGSLPLGNEEVPALRGEGKVDLLDRGEAMIVRKRRREG